MRRDCPQAHLPRAHYCWPRQASLRKRLRGSGSLCIPHSSLQLLPTLQRLQIQGRLKVSLCILCAICSLNRDTPTLHRLAPARHAVRSLLPLMRYRATCTRGARRSYDESRELGATVQRNGEHPATVRRGPELSSDRLTSHELGLCASRCPLPVARPAGGATQTLRGRRLAIGRAVYWEVDRMREQFHEADGESQLDDDFIEELTACCPAK